MKIYQDAEKFINEIYWKESHDKRSALKISEIVDAKLVKDNKEKDPEYYNYRPGVVHSSSIYGCLRGVVHSMIGTPPSTELEARKLGVFMAGNLFEDYIINALGDKVIERQREYKYKYKSITLVGRSDYLINDEGVMRIGENKSVHSDSFWYRQREGTLVAWHNQIQLQIYMWLERILYNHQYEGIFSYISKDDCTVESAPVKFNQHIIDEVILPILEIINAAYEAIVASGLLAKRDAADGEAKQFVQNEINALINSIVPLPAHSIFNENKGQWQRNWLATYCSHHNHCAGGGWLLEATDEVVRKNKELKGTLPKAPKRSKKLEIKPVE